MAEQVKQSAATGRRKTAVARAELVPGSGSWKVNKRELKEYFPSQAMRTFIEQPLQISLAYTRPIVSNG